MLPSENPKLTLADLKLGMQVKASQLSEIYDTYIILTDTEQLPNGDIIGTLNFLNNTLTNDASHLFKKGAKICPIFKEKEYYEGDVVYDE